MVETPSRLDKRKVRIAAQGAAERRRHKRVPLALPGRLYEKGRGEQRCRLIDVSPGGAKLLVKDPPPPNSHIVLLVDGLGRLEGDVIRIGANWLTTRFTMQARKRDRLADAITWRFNMERLGLEEDRVAARKPGKGQATIRLRDGVLIRADVIDVSITGAAFACLERPRVGERVRVGEMTGRVARILERGFAVAFDPPSAGEGEAKPEPGAATDLKQAS